MTFLHDFIRTAQLTKFYWLSTILQFHDFWVTWFITWLFPFMLSISPPSQLSSCYWVKWITILKSSKSSRSASLLGRKSFYLSIKWLNNAIAAVYAVTLLPAEKMNSQKVHQKLSPKIAIFLFIFWLLLGLKLRLWLWYQPQILSKSSVNNFLTLMQPPSNC